MNLKTKMMGLGLAALVASTLSAQDAKRWSVGLNYVVATDALKSVTNTSGAFGGMTADFGWTGKLASSDVPIRLSLGVNYLPGEANTPEEVKVSLVGYYLASDIYINTGVKDLRLTTGLSLNKWRGKAEVLGFSESESVKGVKFGARLGLDYQISENWSANLTYAVSELGLNADSTKGLNPAWVMLGAKFHF